KRGGLAGCPYATLLQFAGAIHGLEVEFHWLVAGAGYAQDLFQRGLTPIGKLNSMPEHRAHPKVGGGQLNRVGVRTRQYRWPNGLGELEQLHEAGPSRITNAAAVCATDRSIQEG